jgi:4-amino-4-deoxy-L-arabinose transferase-like glycosyltransferase
LRAGLLQGHVRQVAAEIEQLGLPASYARLFIPLAYHPVYQDGVLTAQQAPSYPVGFPLHLAAGAALGGWQHAPFHVSPLLGALSVLLIFLVGRQLGLPRAYAYAGAILLAVNPNVLLFSMLPMSDAAAMFWSLVAIWAGLRARQTERWALCAGAAFGVAVLVRPTNTLLLAPLVFCLPLQPKVWLRFVAGGLPLAAIFCAYNWAALGHPLIPGYGADFVKNAFTFGGVFNRFGAYVYWVSVTMTPLLLLGWMGVALDRRVVWRERALLVAWFGVFLVFYAIYDLYPEWTDTRFLLPGYPGLILGALLVTRDLLENWWSGRRWMGWAVGVLLLAVTFGVAARFVHRQQVYHYGRSQILNADAATGQIENCRSVR